MSDVRDTVWFPLALIAVVTVVFVTAGFLLIRAGRRNTFASRPLPERIVYQAVRWAFVLLGGFTLTGYYINNWGVAATIWLLGAPAVYGLMKGWPTDQNSP